MLGSIGVVAAAVGLLAVVVETVRARRRAMPIRLRVLLPATALICGGLVVALGSGWGLLGVAAAPRRYATYEPGSGIGFNAVVLVPALGLGLLAGALLAGRAASRTVDGVPAATVTRIRLFGAAGAALVLVGVAVLTTHTQVF